MNKVKLLIFSLIALVTTFSLGELLTNKEILPLNKELISIMISALITLSLTFFFFRTRMTATEVKDKNIQLFNIKIQNYILFIDSLMSAWESKIIEPSELGKIRKLFYTKVFAFLNSKSLETITTNFEVISDYSGIDLDLENQNKLRKNIFEIIYALREEMGLPDKLDFNKINNIDKVFDKLIVQNEKIERNSQIATNNSESLITFWHFILYDDKSARKNIEQNKVIYLGDGELENNRRTKLVEHVQKGDILFLYSRGFGYVGIAQAISQGYILEQNHPSSLMNNNDGPEGHVKIEKLLLFDNINHIKRDSARLNTIQRIYDRNAIREKLLAKFIEKAQTLKIEINPVLTEIYNNLINPGNVV
ncbi:hypothetical protein [Leptospira kanakyensis]|uniref:hypothetical protein n=1 Tax=Leptospira kanakyensis TaxID=2484968 RepID=UPI00223E6CF8|nr:hypothetical protein [Leptospira kanakyensis]MCW7471702.1 hypothetical protein [Leptospira kanakyensis]